MFKKIYTTLLDLVLPPSCIICSRGNILVCSRCKKRLEHERVHTVSRPTPHIDIVYILCDYSKPIIQKLIHHLKYKGTVDTIDEFYHLMQDTPLNSNRVIIPIPLHPRKHARRGYNQSLLIAQKLQEVHSMTILPILKRKKYTQTQARLSEKQRKRNVKNVFSCNGDAPKHVLLVDDVATTFSTLNSAAEELKKHGCESVHALVLAKDATRLASTPY